MSTTEKYLSQYAEPECNQLQGLSGAYQHVVCLPAYDESPAFIERSLTFLSQQDATLAIIVLNQPDTAQATCEQNRQCKMLLQEQTHQLWERHNLALHAVDSDEHRSSAVLLIDRFEQGEPIPVKQGVGLARKIAADIALQLIAQNIVQSPWIYSTDADALLPENYFALPATDSQPGVAAYVLGYRHISCDNSKVDAATQLYEQRLKAYVEGLRFAGSPYAFNTVGSTLCISADHYAMVRGFPKRAAGEDFYLLNKLRKTGSVVELQNPVIQIQSRISNRTPFGTGPAVTEIINTAQPDAAEIFYHPELFVLLKELLGRFGNMAEDFELKKDSQQPLDWRFYFQDQRSLQSALEQMDFDTAILHCEQNSKDGEQFKTHLTHWFDGFRTLKLLHHLRDTTNHQNLCRDEYLFIKSII